MKKSGNSNRFRFSDSDISVDEWAVKRERGLSDEEAEVFAGLVADNPKFADEVLEAERAMEFIKRVSPEISPDLLADTDIRPFWARPVWQVSGIAAAIVVSLIFLNTLRIGQTGESETVEGLIASQVAPTTERLPDGSVVRVNAGADISVNYSETMREVILAKGEAHFTVAKDADRPFVVYVDDIQVMAVGTAFNVKKEGEKIDVFVTEGTVAIGGDDLKNGSGSPWPGSGELDSLGEFVGYVQFGQKAEIQYSEQDAAITLNVLQTNENELKEALGWRDSLLRFSGSTLDEIALEFERKTGLKIVVRDSALNELEIGGSYPSGDPFGFLNILRNNYGVDWFEDGEQTIVLTKSRQE